MSQSHVEGFSVYANHREPARARRPLDKEDVIERAFDAALAADDSRRGELTGRFTVGEHSVALFLADFVHRLVPMMRAALGDAIVVDPTISSTGRAVGLTTDGVFVRADGDHEWKSVEPVQFVHACPDVAAFLAHLAAELRHGAATRLHGSAELASAAWLLAEVAAVFEGARIPWRVAV